jgi:hypothetical protein
MAKVRLGYFEDFKSSDTLLMEADDEGLIQLATLFRSLAAGEPESVQIHALAFVETHRGLRLTAHSGPRDRGPNLHATSEFQWWLTTLSWEEAAEKVEALVHGIPAHQYLEVSHAHVVVQVSKDEYGDEWWARHG